MRRRHRVGGILDRRFGENDPTMTPEQKAAERFARESERRSKKSSMFNLEDGDDDFQLTHHGRSISFDEETPKEDFAESDLDGSESAHENGGPRKRRRLSEDASDTNGDPEAADLLPERKRSKKEVMEEVIAKSKLHKYERQQAKEDDDDLRRELDKGLPEFLETMRSHRPSNLITQPNRHADVPHLYRSEPPNENHRQQEDADYNERVRQMALDKRSKPSSRTKTEEELAEEEAERLRELERKRLQRMRGASESGEDEELLEEGQEHDESDEDQDDAEAFGLRQKTDHPGIPDLDVEDEDVFVIDKGLVASDSEAEQSFSDVDSEAPGAEVPDANDDEDFTNGVFLSGYDDDTRNAFQGKKLGGSIERNLAYTFPCPQSLDDIIKITKKSTRDDIPIIVQRIRALYHPKLDSANTQKLKTLIGILVEFITHLADQEVHPPFRILEVLIRHVHSLAKSYPDAAGAAFRMLLKGIANDRPLKLKPCDLITLTAISSIFPTSDHFHSVVTPSMLIIARYLGQSPVQSLGDLSIGIYCCSLALKYQILSKRYIPEVVNYLLSTLLHLTPRAMETATSTIPYRPPTKSLSIQSDVKPRSSALPFWKMMEVSSEDDSSKADLFLNVLLLLEVAADQWKAKSAFPEIIEPAMIVLTHLESKANKSVLSDPLNDRVAATKSSVKTLHQASLSTRQPLHLHCHRPLPIKSSIPKFDPSFNPTRHADPDRERANINKLRAEHKRERKGAMRELRKDANFITREALREKKEKDEAYERKFKKLREEIQTEEGREKNEYEREKRKRKGRF